MKFSTLGLSAAALIAPSTAFLIPSTADGVTGSFADRELGLIDPINQILTLDCPGCAFAGSADEDDDLVWVQGIQNSLLLNFSVVDDHAVELNGVRFYPPTNIPQPIPVTQVRADVPLTDLRANIGKYTDRPLRISGYALEIDAAITSAEGVELIPMTFQISALEGHPIDVPALSVKLMKFAEGNVEILPITATAPIASSSPQENDKECEDWPVLCKWRSIIADRIQAMKDSVEKGAGGKGCMKGRPHGSASGKPQPPVHDRPENVEDDERPHHRPGHKPHHPHGMMHHHHRGPIVRFFHMLGRIMVPIVIGIAFGALTYATGWLVGCIVAYIWIRIQARRGDGYTSVAADEEDAMVKDIAAAEIPAEAPPVYSEKEVVPEPEPQPEPEHKQDEEQH